MCFPCVGAQATTLSSRWGDLANPDSSRRITVPGLGDLRIQRLLEESVGGPKGEEVLVCGPPPRGKGRRIRSGTTHPRPPYPHPSIHSCAMNGPTVYSLSEDTVGRNPRWTHVGQWKRGVVNRRWP